MRPLSQWLDEYGESHQNPANKTIHWICVPLIMLGIIGLLWEIPVPATLSGVSPYLNWAVILLIPAIIYWFAQSVTLGIGIAIVWLGIFVITNWLDSLAPPLWLTSIAIFVGAWIGQFIGHVIEGKRPSFFKDMQFLLIGPLWLLAALYRRLGIPY